MPLLYARRIELSRGTTSPTTCSAGSGCRRTRLVARITHDTPDVHPTVVVSTRDRNILAIESQVRGALGNGVDSFLVVIGDTMPQIDHMAHHMRSWST